MTTKEKLLKTIETSKARSAWSKGVKVYAYEMAEEMEEPQLEQLEKLMDNFDRLSYSQFKNELRTILLSGAYNWWCYSWGGCSLIYDGDIAERLCTKSELIKTDYGMKEPNKKEYWLDVQARALSQAFELVSDKVLSLL